MKDKPLQDLPAGRELDALIAEKVMGWREFAGTLFKPDHRNEKHSPAFAAFCEEKPRGWFAPHYSTDISAAMTVLAVFEKKNWAWTLHKSNGKVYCVLIPPQSVDFQSEPVESAELAICLAALAATPEGETKL